MLNEDYSIEAVQEHAVISVNVLKNQDIIGTATLTTDNVDVACITSININDNDVNTVLNDHTLGEILVKFLLKFPNLVRKPEFRFILETPENLRSIIEKHHFDRGEDSNLQNEVLIRSEKLVPETPSKPENIRFSQSINPDKLPQLLSFLNKNAYWQAQLTLDRLELLIKNSRCFFAYSNDEVVGFSRVLTNSTAFASLWDVVVDEQYRGHGIGINLMHNVFTDKLLSRIATWVLFTQTAKGLYEKFGFVSESVNPNRQLLHKFRTQELQPSFMADLIQTTSMEQSLHLNAEQSVAFLFGQQGKRANLPSFWQAVQEARQEITSCPGLPGLSR